MAALAALLLLSFAGLAWIFVRQGRASQADLVITGRPLPPLGQPALPPADSRPAAPRTEDEKQPPAAAGGPTASALVVHVAGAVQHPGVYRMKPGQRVDDAIRAAGGVKPGGDLDALNLASRLEDGQQVRVPLKGATTAETALAGGNGTARRSSATKAEKLTQPGRQTVNLNTATARELQQLPGVGPATAERILAFRKEIGRFEDVEQLLEVAGVGEKKLERMRPFLRVR